MGFLDVRATRVSATKPQEAVAVLAAALKSPESDLRQRAMTALWSMKGAAAPATPAVIAVMKSDPILSETALDLLRNLPDRSAALLNAIDAAAGDPKNASTANAAEALIAMGDTTRGVSRLAGCLSSPDANLRRSAADVLSEIGEPAAGLT
jgi:HEAT repeat protein